MKYSVKFPSRSIEKKFVKRISKITPIEIQDRIWDGILALSNNPRPAYTPKITPPIDVYNYTAQYRLRIGNYRVLYDVDDSTKTCWIIALRDRNERTYK